MRDWMRRKEMITGLQFVRRLAGKGLRSAYRGLLAARYGGRAYATTQNGGSPSILVIRGDAIGDFVLFLPTLRILRRHYAEAKLSLLVGRESAELASAFAPVDDVIAFDRKRYRFNLAYRVRLIQSLRNQRFDVAVNPTYSREPFTDELLYCCGARQRIAFEGDLNNIDLGTRTANNRYVTAIVPASPGPLLESERNREFVERMIGARFTAEDFRPTLSFSQSRVEEACLLLRGEGLDPKRNLIVAMFPGALNPIRIWPLERFARLGDLMARNYGARVLLCGSDSERSVGKRICGLAKTTPASLIGKTTLPQLAGVLRCSALYVGSESGPLHLAVAAGTPTLCVLGGGHFRRFYPYGDPSEHRVSFKEMDCYNCNWQCIHETVRCIEEISLDKVWQETKKMMEEVVLPKRQGVGVVL